MRLIIVERIKLNRKWVSWVSQVVQDFEKDKRERHLRLRGTCKSKHGGRKVQVVFRRS